MLAKLQICALMCVFAFSDVNGIFGNIRRPNIPIRRPRIEQALRNRANELLEQTAENTRDVLEQTPEAVRNVPGVDKVTDYLDRLTKAVDGFGEGPSKQDRLSRLEQFVKPKKLLRKLLDSSAIDAIKTSCTRDPRKCLTQQVKTLRQRSVVFDMAVDSYLRANGGSGRATSRLIRKAKEFVDKQFAKTLAAKALIMLRQGIDPTVARPADIGLFGGDMFLTEEQADKIIFANKRSGPGQGAAQVLGSLGGLLGKRSRRNAIYLEANKPMKWTKLPIPYVFDDKLRSAERRLVQRGLYDIQNQTCVRFELKRQKPNNTPHIVFAKAKFGFVGCGISNIGRTGNQNVIYLNFEKCLDQIVGSTIHETLHSLGVQHEQVRSDRDDYIKIDFSNVNPQVLDLFESGDDSQITGYGTTYDYYSIMHYSAYVGAKDPNKPTMIPKREPKSFFTEIMGQRRRMSQRDAELVRKMYCVADCDDLDVNCGYWANEGFCTNSVKHMLDYCPKSCGFCPIAASEAARRYLD